jgi:tRNA (guanine37-N1)-methyltransferase
MLKQALAGALTEEEASSLSSAFDVIGDIAIVKIPSGIAVKQKLIADEILKKMKNVKTVLKQTSDVEGEFRIRQLEHIGGEERFETIYKESSCLFKVDLKQVYFSPRLATERERIASLVKDDEHIFNMFAGIGTFSVIIAKQKYCTVESVDKNPSAYELATASLRLNKRLKGTVNPVLSDAREFAMLHKEEFDRVLMPLPERAREFLSAAFDSVKKGATIHYYVHVPTANFEDENWIKIHLADLGIVKSFSITKWKRVREVGPKYVQAVADILVES